MTDDLEQADFDTLNQAIERAEEALSARYRVVAGVPLERSTLVYKRAANGEWGLFVAREIDSVRLRSVNLEERCNAAFVLPRLVEELKAKQAQYMDRVHDSVREWLRVCASIEES